MPKCGECKLLVPNPKGTGYLCLGKRCDGVKVTPESNASTCIKFEKK